MTKLCKKRIFKVIIAVCFNVLLFDNLKGRNKLEKNPNFFHQSQVTMKAFHKGSLKFSFRHNFQSHHCLYAIDNSLKRNLFFKSIETILKDTFNSFFQKITWYPLKTSEATTNTHLLLESASGRSKFDESNSCEIVYLFRTIGIIDDFELSISARLKPRTERIDFCYGIQSCFKKLVSDDLLSFSQAIYY